MTRDNDPTTEALARADATTERAAAPEPCFRAVAMEIESGACVYGIRADGPPPLGPLQTLGAYLAHLWGGSPNHEGAFPTLEAAVAHALALPLFSACQTVTILRPRPVSPPPPTPRSGTVH